MRDVICGILSAGRPWANFSKPRNSGTWKYARSTEPSSLRKISILPWPSSRVIGSMVMRRLEAGMVRLAMWSLQSFSFQERRRQAVPVEGAHRVGDTIEDAVDILHASPPAEAPPPTRPARPPADDGSHRTQRFGAEIAHAAGGSETAGARHVAVDTPGPAPRARGRPQARHTLRQDALIGIQHALLHSPETFQFQFLGMRVPARALVAHGAVGRQHRARRGQRLGEQGLKRVPDDLWGWRAAGDIIIHRDGTVQGENRIEQLGQGQLVTILARLLTRRDGAAVSFVEHALGVGQVRQSRDAASLRAYAEGNDDLRLLAQQTGHLQLVRGAHRAVDEGDRDGAIVHRLHILLLEIQRDRPEDDVHRLQDFEQIFRQVEHRLLAAAAGGTPVEGNFWLHATSDRRARSSPVLHSGPSAFNCATISLTTTRTRSPSAAEIHSRRNRSSSMPICLRSLLSNRYRRSAL